jgi:protein phosphatase PTC7
MSVRSSALRAAARCLRSLSSSSEASTSGRAAGGGGQAWAEADAARAGPFGLHTRAHRAPDHARRSGRAAAGAAAPRWRSSLEALAAEPSSSAAAASLPPADATYRVEVVTGDVRGAGSPEPATLTLVGEGGASEAHLLGGADADAGFERGSRKAYALYCRDLGSLRRVEVEQLATGAEAATAEAATGWFLDRVEVAGPGGARWTFPCGAWLGRAGDGSAAGVARRALAPADRCLVGGGTLHQHGARAARRLAVPLAVAVAGFAIPHPEKVAAGAKGANRRGAGWGGEDAYFYADNAETGVAAVGVADGVYMWRDQGIDAGEFSRALAAGAARAVAAGGADAARVLGAAAAEAAAAGVQGSSTFCVALIDRAAGRLAAANVGDSGFMLLGFRPAERGLGAAAASSARGRLAVRYRSPQQEHSFGHPYQLGHHAGADAPGDAMLSAMPVAPGDVVVVGSDGLWDNLFDEEVVAVVEEALLARAPPGAIARALGAAAFAAAGDRRRATPYSQGATAAFDMVYSGGKHDDITAVVLVLS